MTAGARKRDGRGGGGQTGRKGDKETEIH